MTGTAMTGRVMRATDGAAGATETGPGGAQPGDTQPDDAFPIADVAPEDLPARLTAWLNRSDRDMTSQNLKPRDAATLIVIDRSGTTPSVLMGRRHAGLKFMPGKFVFPGGRVEPADRGVPAASELDPRMAERLMLATQRPSLVKARAFAIAAVRETFEETGLMLGQAGAPWPAAWSATTRTASGDAALWDRFAQAGVLPDLSGLQLVARAITPPRRPRRFDARFFAVDATAIAGRVDGMVGPDSELVELVWMPLDDAERLDLPPITKTVLAELDHRIANGFTRDLPVPFYRFVRGRFVRTEL
ncbi:NUDIX hydrolase [Rhodoplanes azumiensis]|uniref:NUDIX hydrolase n=1 Tax=Rhodoplanes azumiensis TaxID=1897628 RepID=A0ABW5AM39_9BRAD